MKRRMELVTSDNIKSHVVEAINELGLESDWGVQTLQILSGTVQISGSESILLTIPYNFKNYEVKTLRISSNILIQARIYEDNTQNNPCYSSVNESQLYDIINVPMTDKLSTTSTGNIYLGIKNIETLLANVSYEIKILNLRSV